MERVMNLENLLAYVSSHGFDGSIDGDAVVFLVPCALNDELCPVGAWERVSTIREARNALGY